VDLLLNLVETMIYKGGRATSSLDRRASARRALGRGGLNLCLVSWRDGTWRPPSATSARAPARPTVLELEQAPVRKRSNALDLMGYCCGNRPAARTCGACGVRLGVTRDPEVARQAC
jgi:hypothetical protein